MQPSQEIELLFVLHALGDDLEFQAPAQLDMVRTMVMDAGDSTIDAMKDWSIFRMSKGRCPR